MLQVLCLDTMSCVKEDGSCMEDMDESGSGESGSGDFESGSGDFGPGDEHHIMCSEGTVSLCSYCPLYVIVICHEGSVSSHLEMST